ncbi:MAG: hydroxymethylbilane synthase [Armatimonadota bacterium]
MYTFTVGTRGSPLALAQTREVIKRLEYCFPESSCRIEIIHTLADKRQDSTFSQLGRSGVFVKEIEQALLRGQIDFAVHSAKDLPSEIDQSLCIAAYLPRENPADVLLSKVGSLQEMPAGATVATGSIRRRAQLLSIRSDLNVVDIRGNLDTRIKKLESGVCDALILAYAGLIRLKLDSVVVEVFDPEVWLPAVGQGAIAVECREADIRVKNFLVRLDDWATRTCVTAERAFLRQLRAGCLAPVGALARLDGSRLVLSGLVASPDGSAVVRDTESGDPGDPESVGKRLADKFLKSDAVEHLHGIKVRFSEGDNRR